MFFSFSTFLAALWDNVDLRKRVSAPHQSPQAETAPTHADAAPMQNQADDPGAPGGPSAPDASPQSSPQTSPAPQVLEEEETGLGEGWAVILYNDEVHSIMEVILAVAAALACDLETAHAITLRAHHNGQATVTITDKKHAEQIASILKTAKLTVELRQM